MSYKSPIEIISNIANEISQDFDKNVLRAVHSYAINVDKEELIKALKYDRNQYNKGFEDGINQIAKDIFLHIKRVFDDFYRKDDIITCYDALNHIAFVADQYGVNIEI